MTDPQELLEYFESRRDAMLSELFELVSMETPTHDVDAITGFISVLRGSLEAAGLDCVEHPSSRGPCLSAQKSGRDPGIVLVGHADTVWPHGTTAERPSEVRDGKLHGPGVFDMKSGVCLILAVARFLQEHHVSLRRRLQVFIAGDEESGSEAAHPLMDELLARDATALVPEPPCPDGSVKIQRKGVGIYELRVQGREAHAGVEPERGVSAIDELARLILELHGRSDPSRGVTLNVGTIEGGTASNVVAGEARCELDLRFDVSEDGEAMEAMIRALSPKHPDARLDVTGGLVFPPLVPTGKSRELAALTCRLAADFGLDVGVGSSGGGSDGSYLASRGLTVIDGLGVDGAGAHAAHEHILVDRLVPRAALLTSLVLALDAE